MENIFASIFTDGTLTVLSVFIVLIVALVLGIISAFVTKYKSDSSKSFFIATSILPFCVAMVIMLVNGNIGAGVAVAGAFGLVRFRSAQGSAKEIAIIFIDMTIGLALGMGYVAYGVIFAIIAFGGLFIFANTKIFDKKDDERKSLRIMIPENMDYTLVFEDIFAKYTKEHKLIKVKSTNMGAMFVLNYDIKLLDQSKQKEFLDDLRCRNANLEIVLENADLEVKDL